MPAPRIAKGIPKPVRKPRDGMSREHLANVRACGCVVCGATAEAHHLLGLSLGRGLSLKSPDKHAIPLCHTHHQGAHYAGNDEAHLMAKHGIDSRALARTLWANRDDPKAMKRAVYRARPVNPMILQ